MVVIVFKEVGKVSWGFVLIFLNMVLFENLEEYFKYSFFLGLMFR